MFSFSVSFSLFSHTLINKWGVQKKKEKPLSTTLIQYQIKTLTWLTFGGQRILTRLSYVTSKLFRTCETNAKCVILF